MYKILKFDDEDVVVVTDKYIDNNNLYIGLATEEELYCDITVNLGEVPESCGYVDVNNSPELEQFITENELGEFTGLTQKSGFVEYPLYKFNMKKIREFEFKNKED